MPAQLKRPNETTMDLEQTIDALVHRKKNLDLDSPERRFINRILTGLRYSYEEAGSIIEDLDSVDPPNNKQTTSKADPPLDSAPEVVPRPHVIE